mgnify:FL=1
MSVEEAKRRLQEAKEAREAIQVQASLTNTRLDIAKKQQAQIARQLFTQGGIDIYRQNQQIQDTLKNQNEKLNRATEEINHSVEAVDRVYNHLSKIDIEALKSLADNFSSLDKGIDQAYADVKQLKQRELHEAIAVLDDEYQAKNRLLEHDLQNKRDELENVKKEIESRKKNEVSQLVKARANLVKEIETLQQIKKRKLLKKNIWVGIIILIIVIIATCTGYLTGKLILVIWSFIKMNWGWFIIPFILIIGGIILWIHD